MNHERTGYEQAIYRGAYGVVVHTINKRVPVGWEQSTNAHINGLVNIILIIGQHIVTFQLNLSFKECTVYAVFN